MVVKLWTFLVLKSGFNSTRSFKGVNIRSAQYSWIVAKHCKNGPVKKKKKKIVIVWIWGNYIFFGDIDPMINVRLNHFALQLKQPI